MAGYPGSGYPGGGGGGYPGQGGYPGGASAPPGGGYPAGGSAPPGGGYPAGGYPAGGYPGGGAAAPPPQSTGFQGYPGSRPQVDPMVAQWFNAVDSDRSGQITASELQRALVNGNWSHFSEEACRMMIDLYDSNSSGSIDLGEFQQLFDCINQWKSIFQGYDTDKSGTIELDEMTKAFQQMGYRFTPTFVQNLLAKFDTRTRKLTLDNFIVACVQIKRLTDGFRIRDREQRGQATFMYEDFIGLAMGVNK